MTVISREAPLQTGRAQFERQLDLRRFIHLADAFIQSDFQEIGHCGVLTELPPKCLQGRVPPRYAPGQALQQLRK